MLEIINSEQLTGLIIATVSAVFGYLFREYRNQARPFFQITAIHGSLAKLTDSVTLNDETIDRLEDSKYIKHISKETTLREVEIRSSRASQIKSNWNNICLKIDAVNDAPKDARYSTALADLFRIRFFENALLKMLISDRLTVASSASPTADPVPIFDSEDHEGSVWLGFPGSDTNFGTNFNNPAIRAKCEPCLNSIKNGDREATQALLSDFKQLMSAEHAIAVEVVHDLKDIVDLHSRWLFVCYFANLSPYPMLIESEASVHVSGHAEVNVPKERCYFAKIKSEGDSADLDDLLHPIVVKSQSDMCLILISEKTQEEMEFGSILRNWFEKGDANFDVEISVRKVGLLKRQDISSQSSKFRSTIDDLSDVHNIVGKQLDP